MISWYWSNHMNQWWNHFIQIQKNGNHLTNVFSLLQKETGKSQADRGIVRYLD